MVDYAPLCKMLYDSGATPKSPLYGTLRDLIKEEDGIMAEIVGDNAVCSIFPRVYEEYQKYYEKRAKRCTVVVTTKEGTYKCSISYGGFPNIFGAFCHYVLGDEKLNQVMRTEQVTDISFIEREPECPSYM